MCACLELFSPSGSVYTIKPCPIGSRLYTLKGIVKVRHELLKAKSNPTEPQKGRTSVSFLKSKSELTLQIQNTGHADVMLCEYNYAKSQCKLNYTVCQKHDYETCLTYVTVHLILFIHAIWESQFAESTSLKTTSDNC